LHSQPLIFLPRLGGFDRLTIPTPHQGLFLFRSTVYNRLNFFLLDSMKESEFRASSSTIPSSCLQPQQNISSVLIEHCPVVIDRPPKSLPRRSMPSRPLAGSPPPHRQLPKPNFNLNSAININILGFKQPQPQQSYPSVTSIHESGLPSRQHHLLGRSSYLSKCLVSRQEQSLVWLTPGTRKPFAAMPDYENYFYI